jgi:FtsP/CotA-like multicopper oxidase with cupredoxin domain
MRQIVVASLALITLVVAGATTVWPSPQDGPDALKQPVALPNTVVPIGAVDPVCREQRRELAKTIGFDLVARASRRRIGPYEVQVGGFVADPAAAPSHDSFAPMLISANAGQTLRIDLVDKLAPNSTDPNAPITNLHTHGLILSPKPPSVAGIPCPPGDYVIHIPDDLPTSLLGLDGPGASSRMAHPSGLFWFHAHLHGESQSQVTQGLSGLISIGDPKTHLHVDRLDTHGAVVEDAALTKQLRDRQT